MWSVYIRTLATKAGTLSRGLRGEKLRDAVTSWDQLTQSPPIAPELRTGLARAQTCCYRWPVLQYWTVLNITARHHVGNVCKLKRTLDHAVHATPGPSWLWPRPYDHIKIKTSATKRTCTLSQINFRHRLTCSFCSSSICLLSLAISDSFLLIYSRRKRTEQWHMMSYLFCFKVLQW